LPASKACSPRIPQDGKGWEVLAPIYLRAGRFDDALQAYATPCVCWGRPLIAKRLW